MTRRHAKQGYNVFKVSINNKKGWKRYIVVNQITGAIQSSWSGLIEARNVARDLNAGLNHRVF